MWLLSIILLELIVVLGIGYFIVKKLTSKPKEVVKFAPPQEPIVDSYAIERAVQKGVISAIKEIDTDKAREKHIKDTARRERAQGSVYMTPDGSDEPVKRAGGNLVPFNLTESEKEILNMFYDEN